MELNELPMGAVLADLLILEHPSHDAVDSLRTVEHLQPLVYVVYETAEEFQCVVLVSEIQWLVVESTKGNDSTVYMQKAFPRQF